MSASPASAPRWVVGLADDVLAGNPHRAEAEPPDRQVAADVERVHVGATTGSDKRLRSRHGVGETVEFNPLRPHE